MHCNQLTITVVKLSHVPVAEMGCCICTYAAFHVPAHVHICCSVCLLSQRARTVEAILPAELHASAGLCKLPKLAVFSHF